MADQKLFALKGDAFYRISGSTGAYKPFMNALSIELTPNIETISQQSNGDAGGTIAEDEITRSMTFSGQFQSRHKGNLELFLMATSEVVAASGSPVAFTLPAGKAGDLAYLPHGNITDTTFGTLVEGTDYAVKAKNGAITYLADIDTATPGTFEHDEYVNYGVFAAQQVELEIVVTSEKTGQTYLLYRVKVSPSQAYAIVSSDNTYGSATLTGSVLAKEDAPNSSVLGKFGRVRTLVD